MGLSYWPRWPIDNVEATYADTLAMWPVRQGHIAPSWATANILGIADPTGEQQCHAGQQGATWPYHNDIYRTLNHQAQSQQPPENDF